MIDWLLPILGHAGFALFGFAYGHAVGWRAGRKSGFYDGRKTGAFWERWKSRLERGK